MSRKFSLAYLTIPGIEAMEQIRIAGETGYDYVSLRTIPMGQPGEPQLRLEEDPQLTREIGRQLERYGVKLLDIELVRVREDLPRDYRAAFEAGAGLGATQVLSSVWTHDREFAADFYADVCDQAAQFGMDVNLEFPVVSCMPSFSDCVKLMKKVNKPNLKLFVDTVHAYYDNLTPEQIAQVPAEDYGFIHLCDCPVETDGVELTQIIRAGREYCGYGKADIVGMLKALPERICSIELPNLAYIERYGAQEHARRCLETAKALCDDNGL